MSLSLKMINAVCFFVFLFFSVSTIFHDVEIYEIWEFAAGTTYFLLSTFIYLEYWQKEWEKKVLSYIYLKLLTVLSFAGFVSCMSAAVATDDNILEIAHLSLGSALLVLSIALCMKAWRINPFS